MAAVNLPPSPWETPKYTGDPWWTKDTVAVVTGSNRGIGFEVLRQLAMHGLTTVMTDKDDCQDSMASLKAQGFDSVYHHPLDVTSTPSVEALAAWLKEEFGGIDILINNAGVWLRDGSLKSSQITLDVNFLGAKRVTEGLMNVLRPGARILNTTSRLGFYQRLGSEKIKNKLRDVDHLSTDDLVELGNQYVEDLKNGRHEEEGWLSTAAIAPDYSISKMLLTAYTLVTAKSFKTENPEHQKAFIAAFCPGLTQSAMTAGHVVVPGLVPHPIVVGADSGVWLALLPKHDLPEKYGKLWAERLEYNYTWAPWIDPFSPQA